MSLIIIETPTADDIPKVSILNSYCYSNNDILIAFN
jgi:hypothetical protein